MLWGRTRPLAADLRHAPDGWAAARTGWPQARPERNDFPELERAPHWLDRAALSDLWQTGFDKVRIVEDIPALLSHLGLCGPVAPAGPPASARTLARLAVLNPRLQAALASGLILPRKARAQLVAEIALDGPPLAPEAIARALAHPERASPLLPPCDPAFDADRITSVALRRMQRMTLAADIGSPAKATAPAALPPGSRLPAEAHATYARLARSRFAPHNRIAPDPDGGPAFAPLPPRRPAHPERVLVACVKDEGPYLLDWLAHHLAIGIDHVVIYSNDCSDGTDDLLDLIAEDGWLTHVDNSDWQGTSPQQAALNHAVTLPLLQQADWVLHIDVDEYVNIRCGNGTLDALFDACPGATHFALTWRLFGAGRVTGIADRPVIEQFTRCAPAFCPKPHTAWGFKTLGRQIGAYDKLSCHRPTKPVPGRVEAARWVNGAGRPIGGPIAQRGWRSSIDSIGYDLVQLNHYALRARDAFLIKRKRGRALHVDRTIGRNYWLRMDWTDHEDRSVLRHLPRLLARRATFLRTPEIADAHRAALAWHRARAAELAADPEMRALIDEISALRLTQTERAAWAMTLDTDS